MKRILALAFAASLCLPLAACNLGAPPASPGQVAAGTALDEKALAGAELAYQAAVTAAAVAVDAGLLDAAAKAQVKQLDAQAYAALQAARAAYAAGNAPDYTAAVTSAMTAVADFGAAVHSNQGAAQ